MLSPGGRARGLDRVRQEARELEAGGMSRRRIALKLRPLR